MGRASAEFSLGLSSDTPPLMLPIDTFSYTQTCSGTTKYNPLIKISNCAKRLPCVFSVNESAESIVSLCEERCSKLEHEQISDWCVPRALLRPLYSQRICDLGPLFDSFHSIVTKIQDGSFYPKSHLTAIIKEAIDTGFPESITSGITELDEEKSKKFSILIAVVYRVGTLEILKKETGICPLQALSIQLLIDTHIDLICEMNRERMYKDSNLSSVTKYHTGTRSLYVTNYPHDMRFAYPGDLPNMSQIVDMTNIWVDTLDKKKDTTLAQALCKLVISKTQIYKCQTRNVNDLIDDYLLKFPDLVVLFRKFILLSMLGNYTLAKFRPSVTARCHILDFFGTDHMYFTNDQIRIWIKENSRLALFFIRELYVYIVASNPVLDAFAEAYDGWEKTKKVIMETGDSVRNVYSDFLKCHGVGETFRFGTHFHDEIDRVVSTGNKNFLGLVKKLTKATPQVFVSREFEKVHASKAMDKLKETRDLYSDYIGEETEKNMKMIVSHMYETETPSSPLFVKTKWLKAFGISESSYTKFRDMWYEYCCGGMPDNSVKVRIRKIFEDSELDFHIIRAYLHYVVEFSNTAEYLTSIQTLINQESAYKMKIRSPPWNGIVKDHLHIYYCHNCNTCANVVLNDDTCPNPKYINSITSSSVGYNIKSGELVCMSELESACTKKMKTELQKTKTEIVTEKHASLSRKYKSKMMCVETPVENVPLFGTIKCMGDSMYTRCSKCAGLIEYGPKAISHSGITCGLHEPHPSFFLSKRIGNRAREEMKMRACYNCGTFVSLDGTPTTKSLFVLDYTDHVPVPRVVFLCESHYEYIEQKKGRFIPKLHEVEDSLKNVPQKMTKKTFID